MIGKLPVADLTMDDALRVLQPIWKTTKNWAAHTPVDVLEQAERLTRRAVIPIGGLHFGSAAIRLKWKAKPQAPAGRTQPRSSRRSHTPHSTTAAIPAHMAILRATEGVPERMAEFCILTTVRTRPILEMGLA